MKINSDFFLIDVNYFETFWIENLRLNFFAPLKFW